MVQQAINNEKYENLPIESKMFSSAIINGSLIGFLILAGISLCNGQEEKQEQISDRLHRVKRIVNGVIPQDKGEFK